ncbi:PREDICTED: alpha-2-macroglobulin-like protein 1 [Acanthisitta chloris]|uniref:alpha-2-macroglobulin-like protein 1 n=1 Tax=Acanthisitta chloris TaxID=57068 RepID=UPI0004F0DFF2|nr:PREDICTED: alpha-2-macroglobulin-like protein 1 [Acanthisitta chloris]
MRIAILLSLLFHAAAAFHQLHYLVVIPAALHYPSTQIACLHVTCHEAKIQVNLVLERSAGHELLMQETTQKKKTFLCTKFWVAPPADGTEEIATVKLTITGKGVNIEEKKKVLICKTRSGTIIQTDKPIYQPGQTVKFRIVTLDEEFIALNDSISLFLQDPKNNRIEQWLNVVPQGGIADLSFQLSDEPLLGTYIINVTSVKAYGSFSVKEHVLPKFEVIFEAPNQIYALDTTFPLRICGRYLHGKSVQGMVHVSLCQKIAPFLPSASKPNLCHKFSNQTDKAGCFFTNVRLSSFSRDFRYYQDSIVAEASLVEDATEIHVNASHKLLISRIGGMALFDDVNSYYHNGEVYRGKIKVIDYQGKALKHKEVLLAVSCGEQQFKHKYMTGDSGTASFSLNTTAWNSTSASLEASVLRQDLDREPGTVDLNYQRASYFIRPFYSTSRSFLSIVRVPETIPCGKIQAVQVDFRIYEEDLEHGPKRVIFSYFVTGKRGIVHAGQKTVWVGLPRMLEGFFSIPLTFSSIYAPAPRLVVYVIFPNGKIIADSAIFSVSMCFRNKVELSFSTPETLPGSQVGLRLLADPGSMCAVWAVDQNVLLKSGKELSSHLIYGLFPSVHNSRYPRQVSEDDRSCGFPNSDEPDVFTAFREMGLKIMSNTNIRKPRVCPTTSLTTVLRETGTLISRPMLMFAQPHKEYNSKHLPIHLTSTYRPVMFPPVSSAEEKVYKHFPQAWLWDLYSVGPSGNKNVTVTVPDTIAEWKAEMFCAGPNGIGLAPTSSLLVFKPFLVELPLPSSVIQGETFNLKATVFNNLQQCMKIQVTLEEFANFQLKPCKDCVYSSCLCAREAKTFQWSVTAEKLGLMNITLSTEAVATEELCGEETPFVPKQGQKDRITQLIQVRPEGVLVEKAHSSILCPEKGNPAQEFVSLMLPLNVVEGSVRATISVTGDLMGMVLQNLDHLVQMPHGCGEQNMVLFAPIVYVLQYLEKTRQLTPEIKERATGFLRNGKYNRWGSSLGCLHHCCILGGRSNTRGRQIHWSQTSSKPTPTTSPWSQPVSADVELTAYILLALLSKPNITGADLTTASGIVAWLTRQQNAYGGFASTQDTVVALQALAKYAALTYSTQGVAEVRVRSHGGFGRKFQVSYQNRLLVQEAALTEVPGKFSVQAHGSCCVFTRMVLRYNTPFAQDSTAFALQVKTEPVNCTEDNTHTVSVNVRYTGKRSISNMVIVEVSLPTGFVLTPGSGMSVRHWHSVRRTEKTKEGVAIYLDKLSHNPESYVLHLEQEVGVTNLKPGHVRVYDYYHPEDQALADYKVLCI